MENNPKKKFWVSIIFIFVTIAIILYFILTITGLSSLLQDYQCTLLFLIKTCSFNELLAFHVLYIKYVIPGISQMGFQNFTE